MSADSTKDTKEQDALKVLASTRIYGAIYLGHGPVFPASNPSWLWHIGKDGVIRRERW